MLPAGGLSLPHRGISNALILVAFHLPEILPVGQVLQRSLELKGLALPRNTRGREGICDDVNSAHRTFIRSGLAVPRITHLQPLQQYESRSSNLFYICLLVAIAFTFVTKLFLEAWVLPPWIAPIILAPTIIWTLLPAITSTRLRRGEWPWIRSSQFNTEQLRARKSPLAIGVWCSLATSALLFLLLTGYYSAAEGPYLDQFLAIIAPVLGMYLAVATLLWVWVRWDLWRARRAQRSSAQPEDQHSIDAPERVLQRIQQYSFLSEMWTSSMEPEDLQAMQSATARVADELVAEHTITPELAQRLKNATWWESRALYTTPEFTPGAPFPTPAQLTEAAQRV